MVNLKKCLKYFFSSFGYSISRIKSNKEIPLEDPFKIMNQLFIHHKNQVIIFDVGAYIGNLTEKFLEHFPNSNIHSFEPFVDSYSKLAYRFKNYSTVKPWNIALGDKTGIFNFHSNGFAETNSLLMTDGFASEIWGEGILTTNEIFKVPVSTIDSFCINNNINYIHILKIDVQGSELYVLKGAENFLRKKQIEVVYLEIINLPTYVGQGSFMEIIKILDLNQFELIGLYNISYASNGHLRQLDALFKIKK